MFHVNEQDKARLTKLIELSQALRKIIDEKNNLTIEQGYLLEKAEKESNFIRHEEESLTVESLRCIQELLAEIGEIISEAKPAGGADGDQA